MYLRFTTKFLNEFGKDESGLFNAFRFIRESPLTQTGDVSKLKDLNAWFSTNLAAPDRFSNSKNKNPESVSLSWFKDTAKGHIKKIYEIREVLDKYNITLEVVSTKNPGYIVYEDDYQVSAIPFKTDRKSVL